MTSQLAPPPYGTEPTWQHTYALYGLLLGYADYGRPISLTSVDEDAVFAVTIRNLGTGGALSVLATGGGVLLNVTDTGVLISNLTVVGAMTVAQVTVNGNLTVNGNTILGDSIGDSVTVGGTLGVAGATTLAGLTAGGTTLSSLGVTGSGAVSVDFTVGGLTTLNDLVVVGNSTIGNANTDTLTVIGVSTFRNAASSATQLFVDAGNNRVIVGSSTALGSDTTPALHVVGRLYVAPESAADLALQVRRSSAATVGWGIGVSSVNDLLFKDDGGTEVFRVGDQAAVYQAVVTGGLHVTGPGDFDGDMLLGNAVGDAIDIRGTVTLRASLTSTTGIGIDIAGSSVFQNGLTITAGGISITAGLLTLGSGQIAFPATQNPSANANTLDDYEEGTWPPAVGGTATYTTQTGTYTKIGRAVFFQAQLVINSIGTGSTNTISGLPFTVAAAGSAAAPMAFWGTTANTYVHLTGLCVASGTSIQLYGATAAAASLTLTGAMQNGTNLIFSGVYFV